MLIPERVPHPADRLQTLARVIRVVNSLSDLDAVLEVLMDHLIELLGAERGFIMLVDRETGALEFTTARNFTKENLYHEEFQVSRSIVFRVFGTRQPVLTSNAQADERFQAAPSIQEYGLRAVMCAPMIDVRGQALGVLYVDNRLRLGAFEEEDMEFMGTFAHEAAAVLERTRLSQERNRIRELFGRYVSPAVVEQILARPGEALAAERRRVTVMFSDMRGFSSLAESTPPDRLLQILNEYYEDMAEIIFAYKGTLLSFLGDGLLAVFGAPLPLPGQESCAVSCAREMLRRVRERNRFRIGIGLATGDAVVGDLGTTRRREYTVIGDAVNTAARLEKLTKEKGFPLLMDEETWSSSCLEGAIRLGRSHLSGKQRPVVVWAL
ncbi:MAG: GAF domain-containing protein [Armatimonadetes bacterium]|nr:GAF domain-containing protein [Armatimonadota bacterium]